MTNLDLLIKRALGVGFTPENSILCGSAALAVVGLRDVNDLDLLVSRERWDEITGINDLRSMYGRQIWRVEGIDAFDTLPRLGLTFDQVIKRGAAVPIHLLGGWRVLDLRHVLAIKALAPENEKHTADMRAIVGAL